MPSSSLIRWLDTSTARPSSASDRRKTRIQRMPSGSSPLIGSSNTSTGGSPSMAAAIPSRCAIPSEKPPVRLRAAVGEADELEHLVDAPGREAVAPREPEQMAARAPPGMRRACVEERADLAERRAQIAVAPAADHDLAGVGRVEPEDQAHRRRLPGAVRPDEPRDAARLDPERQVVDGDGAPVSLRETVRFDRCAHAEHGTSAGPALSSRPGAVFARPLASGDALAAPSPSRGTTQSRRSRTTRIECRGRDNGFDEHDVSATPSTSSPTSPRGRRSDAQRVLAGPGRAAGLRARARPRSRWPRSRSTPTRSAPAMIANLLATLPLALARRHVAWATGAIVFGVLLAIATDGGTLTIAALLGARDRALPVRVDLRPALVGAPGAPVPRQRDRAVLGRRRRASPASCC